MPSALEPERILTNIDTELKKQKTYEKEYNPFCCVDVFGTHRIGTDHNNI